MASRSPGASTATTRSPSTPARWRSGLSQPLDLGGRVLARERRGAEQRGHRDLVGGGMNAGRQRPSGLRLLQAILHLAGLLEVGLERRDLLAMRVELLLE